MTDRSVYDRFWAKVDISGGPDVCWPWMAHCDRDGYGRFRRDGKDLSAHRVAWELVHGPIPEGACVLHHCDSPPCCNPFLCLFLGSKADNMADMVAKGRARFVAHPGESHGQAKLTEYKVRQILGMPSESLRALAARFDVSKSCILDIRSGRTWRHIVGKTRTQ